MTMQAYPPSASSRFRRSLSALTAGLLLAGAVGVAPAADGLPGGPWRGRPLHDALRELGALGLKIVFTTQVVPPDLEVEHEPTASDPRRILDQLLAPHGLAARRGPGETLVVVPGVDAPPGDPGSVAGRVVAADDGAPIDGAEVRLSAPGGEARQARSGADGGFRITDPGAGPFRLEAGARGFVPRQIEALAVRSGEHVDLEIRLERAPLIEDELVVTPSRVSLMRSEPASPLALSREEILALPHLGDDFFRALTLMPGVSANDVSAQFHVRGGRRDETLILIDGQEIYDAYHLKDFDSALSFIAPATLRSADLSTGGFSAQHGDRMSGVLDMTTLTPTGDPRFRVGVGVLAARAGGSGTFHDERGRWLAEVRRGAIDLVGRLLGDEDPQYWDAFAKLDYRFGRRHAVRANLLHSDDELDFEALVAGERKRLETDYESTYLWLTGQTIVGSDLLVETAGSMASIERDRRGIELEDDLRFSILDLRDQEVLGLRQDWAYQLGPKQLLSWGWQTRRFDVAYDYVGTLEFDNPLARIRHDGGVGGTVYRDRFEERHDSAYLAHRLRPAPPLTLELGLRYDRHSLTGERRASPRLNLAWAVGRAGVVRLAWGGFNQSQRPYELQVEDGETSFHPVERSEHRVVGFETLFEGGPGGRGVALRVELYQRDVGNPRPRYENLYEPINAFPEVEPDRVRIEPDRSRAQGLEIFLRGGLGRNVDWWVNYAWAETEDRIDGAWTPRIFDQTHALNIDFDVRLWTRWRLNAAWRFHTGWPTTPLTLEPRPDGAGGVVFVPVLGAINSERLSSYHRLDLRASRGWRRGSLAIDLYLDVQNVYNRKNAAGFDVEIDETLGTVRFVEEAWAGLLPSAGISLEF